jgi:hypothetical protein
VNEERRKPCEGESRCCFFLRSSLAYRRNRPMGLACTLLRSATRSVGIRQLIGGHPTNPRPCSSPGRATMRASPTAGPSAPPLQVHSRQES